MDKYTHARTCVYNINYHIVWCVKYRRKVLTLGISNRLYELVQSVAEEKGFKVVECKVGEGDHVHCFVSAPPEDFGYPNSKISEGYYRQQTAEGISRNQEIFMEGATLEWLLLL